MRRKIARPAPADVLPLSTQLCFAADDAPDIEPPDAPDALDALYDHCAESEGEPFILDAAARTRAKAIYVAEGDIIIPVHVQPHERIVNAPRPLPGAVRWQGPYLTGVHYAVGDPAVFGDAWARDDAYTVRILSAAQCADVLEQRCQRSHLTTAEYAERAQMPPAELAAMFTLPWPKESEVA